MKETLNIKGANSNNLKSVDVEIPLKKITCFAGPSGSGKSSLAFHTIYNESKRRFLNSFPSYVKFFSDRPSPVDVEEIYPVLPVFALPQINPIAGTRSIVADSCSLSEIFQSLFFNFGKEKCPIHKRDLEYIQFSDQCMKSLLDVDGEEKLTAMVLKEDFLKYFKDTPFPSRSFNKVISVFDESDPYWEVFRFKKSSIKKVDLKAKPYIDKSIRLYLVNTENKLISLNHVKHKMCVKCNYEGMKPIVPAKFSAMNALGACPVCKGFGSELKFDEEKLFNKNLSVLQDGVLFLQYKPFRHMNLELMKVLKKEKISLKDNIDCLPTKFWNILYDGKGTYCGFNELFKYLERKKYKPTVRIYTRARQKEIICSECNGTRINREVASFTIPNSNMTYDELWHYNFNSLNKAFVNLKVKDKNINKIIEKIINLTRGAIDLGLGHLGINRKLKSLSTGEYQRILLLKYMNFEGTDSLFVFDEPSLGLSLEECKKLKLGFDRLIEQGNTVLIIDHNEYFHSSSDYFIEMGPGAGKYGGEILYAGIPKKMKNNKKVKNKKNNIKTIHKIKVINPSLYNINFKNTEFVREGVNLIHGASGSGKTSVYINCIANYIKNKIDGNFLNSTVGTIEDIKGNINFDDVLLIDSNLTRFTSRSTVGSMTGFNPIVRKHFSSLAVSKSMGLVDGHFSSNSQLGQCPKCEGKGVEIVEMQFLEDITLECEDCKGVKLKPVYAKINDGLFSVHESFTKPMHEVLEGYKLTPKYRRIYEYVKLLKLDYLSLDRQVNSLSGGEKQRLYLLSKLQKNVFNTLICFENLSFGLSRSEVNSIGIFLENLIDKKNTIILIDQNDEFDQYADLIISL